MVSRCGCDWFSRRFARKEAKNASPRQTPFTRSKTQVRLQDIIGGLCCPDCAPRSGLAGAASYVHWNIYTPSLPTNSPTTGAGAISSANPAQPIAPQSWVGAASGAAPQVFTDDTAPAPIAQQKIETVFSPIATGAAPAVIAPSSDSGSAGGAAPNISLDVAPPQVESSVPWGLIAALAAGAFVLSNNSRSSNRGIHRRKS